MSTQEKTLRVIEENFQPTCQCASRTCGPHRCWPSRWGWMIVGGLLIYAITLHSFQISERSDLRGKLVTDVQMQAGARVTLALQEATKDWHHQFEEWQKHAQAKQAIFENKLLLKVNTVTELLERATHLSWALATPDVERDIQLKQELDRLAR